jgi:hypothetical protein
VDLSTCQSKWVTQHQLHNWWIMAHNNYQTYQEMYDLSGHHDFNFDQQMDEFVTSFCHESRDCCQIAVL